MPNKQVLQHLEAAAGLLASGDVDTFELSEMHVGAALQGLKAHSRAPFLTNGEVLQLDRQCRRATKLIASAQEIYLGLMGITSIQALGYGSVGSKPTIATGRRFVIDG